MTEDVSFPRFSRPRSSRPRSSRPVPGLSTNCYPRTQQARKNDAATGSFCTHLFSPVSSFSIYLPCLYLPCLYISLVFISPLFLYLPRTLGLSLFYTLSSHPRTAGHATSPGRQLQIIRAAGAYLHQNGFTSILVHLCSSHDVCGLYSGV